MLKIIANIDSLNMKYFKEEKLLGNIHEIFPNLKERISNKTLQNIDIICLQSDHIENAREKKKRKIKEKEKIKEIEKNLMGLFTSAKFILIIIILIYVL